MVIFCQRYCYIIRKKWQSPLTAVVIGHHRSKTANIMILGSARGGQAAIKCPLGPYLPFPAHLEQTSEFIARVARVKKERTLAIGWRENGMI